MARLDSRQDLPYVGRDLVHRLRWNQPLWRVGGTEPTGWMGLMCSPVPLDILHLSISCPEVEIGDSRSGNVHVVSTSSALWTKMLFCPFSVHKDISVPNY